jgi:hypothetical protein
MREAQSAGRQRVLQEVASLQEENRVLRAQLSEKRSRVTHQQRRRLTAKAKAIAAGRVIAR